MFEKLFILWLDHRYYCNISIIIPYPFTLLRPTLPARLINPVTLSAISYYIIRFTGIVKSNPRDPKSVLINIELSPFSNLFNTRDRSFESKPA
jgi:hypothetical protein